jgi:hypothetical protein
MTLKEPFQTILKKYKIELSILRTPKLKDYLIEVLRGEKSLENAEGEYSIASAVRQIPWISADSRQTYNELSASLRALDALIGPYSVLECELINELPQNFSERKVLIERICNRIFSVPSGRRMYITEPEFNSRLAMLVTDVAQVRRYSVDLGIVERSGDGTRYWLKKSQTHS